MEPTDSRITNRVKFFSDKKQQVYGFGLVTVIVFAVLIIGAVKPSIETMVRVLSEIKKKEMVLGMLEEKINTINSLAIQYAEFEETADDLPLIFPDNGDFSLFLANIESITQESGFELSSVSFTSKAIKINRYNLLSPMSVQISTVGKRQNLIPYLKNLENLPMYPEINSVSFSTEVDEDGNTRFSVSMLIYKVKIKNFY